MDERELNEYYDNLVWALEQDLRDMDEETLQLLYGGGE